MALARLARPECDPYLLAQACVASEGATDPLMLPRPERVLWASRRAVPLRTLPALPRFEVLGGFFGPPRRTDPRDQGFPAIDDLIAAWQGAAWAGDLAALAQLASISARRILHQRGQSDDPTTRLADDLGALGIVIAHTGSARGLIFAPGAVPPDAGAHLRRAGFRQIVQFRAGGA